MSQNLSPERITIQGVHLDLTPDRQEALQSKFATLLRHDPSITRLNIRLHKNQSVGNGYHYRATVQVECTGVDMVAGSEGMDAYATLDNLSQKLDEQLGRRHGRRSNPPHPIDLEADRPPVGETPHTPPHRDNDGSS
jgi:ribosomal subunit interface protein